MGVDETTIVPTTLMLSGFSGKTQRPLGKVTLITKAKGVKLSTTYNVVDFLCPYNAIVGRPWIHNMKAMSSSLHHVLKFPTSWGIQEIRGDQGESRECYTIAMKVTTRASQRRTPRDTMATSLSSELPSEELEEVVIKAYNLNAL